MKKLVFLLAILVQTCFSTEALAKLYKYYFYPEVNTYYDINAKRWVYKQDGYWVRNIAMPENVEQLGQRVTVWSNTDEIWYDNQRHITSYENGDYEPTWTRIKETLPIARAEVPAVGTCRYWYADKKDSEQPVASKNYEELRVKAPLGIWLISRPSATIMKIEKFSSAAPGVIRQLRYYHIK